MVFAPICLLQLVNLFWYFLIWRILIRFVYIKTHVSSSTNWNIRAIFATNLDKVDDDRSDNECDGDNEDEGDEKNN